MKVRTNLRIFRYIKDGSGAERMDARLKKDGETITWVAYPDFCDDNCKVIAVSPTVGCVGRCKFCVSGRTRPFKRRLLKEEMAAQVLPCLDGRKGQKVNFACEGDFCSNFYNCCGAIEFLLRIGHNLSFIATTIGDVRVLKNFLRARANLPVTFYWSVNFLEEDMLAYYMPGAINGGSLVKKRDAFQSISRKTGRKTTASWVVMAGLNDSREDAERLDGFFGGRPEFEIKLMALEPGSLPNIETSQEDVARFAGYLGEFGLPYRMRQIIGREIKAGCGTTVPL
ncbi:MAG: hypothetical protein Q8N69_03375 [bacterium]|nr:hypothetical protein [bacterium]